MYKWMFIAIAVLLLGACSPKDQGVIDPPLEVVTEEQGTDEGPADEPLATFDRGRLEADVYSNDFFDLSLELPKGWVVLSRDEIDAIMNLGKEVLESEDSTLVESLESSEVVSLMGIFKYPRDSKVTVNPSMLISAESIHPSSGIRDGQDYLEKSKAVLLETGLAYDFEDVTTLKYDGQTYGFLKANIDMGEVVIRQSFYALFREGYVVNIIMTYTTEDGMVELRSVLGE